VTLLLLLCLSFPSSADDTGASEQRARELYENGVILYDEGLYEDAIIAWEEAYSLSARPLLLYNIASAQERLGQWQQTLETLNRYRAFATADERARLDRRITNLERRIASEASSAVQQGVAIEEPIVTSVQETTSMGPRLGWLTPTAFVFGGAGLASGTVLGLQARSARQDALSLCVDGGSSLLCPSTAEEALQRDRFRSRAADASFVIAGASLLSGAALVVWADASVQVLPGGLLLTGRF
jgi:tetratricopeptide (TPR) repeat protein